MLNISIYASSLLHFILSLLPTEISTLSLHDALPICRAQAQLARQRAAEHRTGAGDAARRVPRSVPFEAALSRIRGADQPRAHRVGIPQVQLHRHRPAAVHPAGPARPLLAADRKSVV